MDAVSVAAGLAEAGPVAGPAEVGPAEVDQEVAGTGAKGPAAARERSCFLGCACFRGRVEGG